LRDEGLIDLARTNAQRIIDADPTLAAAPELAKALALLQADAAAEYIDKG